MALDESWKDHFLNEQKANTPRRPVDFGGGDGQPPGMSTDIALLKQRADHTDARLERMEGKLDRLDERMVHIIEMLGSVATKTTVWAALGTGAGIAFAVISIFVGVLAYLQDQRIATRPEAPAAIAAAVPAPIIINMPPWPAQPVAPPPRAN